MMSLKPDDCNANGGVACRSKCSMCEDDESDLFNCDSCDCADTDSSQLIVNSFLCGICILSHLKRGHIVKDVKGQEPLVCENDKMLKNQYCRTCDSVFCWACMKDHSEHKFDNLDNRASELKANVFEMMNNLEQNEKPLRTKKEEIDSKIAEHITEQECLRECFLSEVENLKQTGLKVIDENCLLFDEVKQNVGACIEKIVDLQAKMRELLSVSNSHLVKDYASAHSDVTAAIEEAERMLIENFHPSKFDLGKLKNSFAEYGERLKSDLLSKKIAKSAAYFICSDRYDYLFRVTCGSGKVNCERVVVNGDSVSYTGGKEADFKQEVSHCFPIHHDKQLLMVLFLTTKCKAYIFDPFKQQIELEEIQYPTQKFFLWPYLEEWDQVKTPDWSYWDEKEKLIKFTHSEELSVKCDVMPSVRMGSYDWNTICFITTEAKIIIVDINRNQFLNLSCHGLSEISFVSTYGSHLFIWCSEEESIWTSYRVNDKYTAPVKHVCNRQSLTTSVSVNRDKFSLLPGLRNESGEIETSLFAVKSL